MKNCATRSNATKSNTARYVSADKTKGALIDTTDSEINNLTYSRIQHVSNFVHGMGNGMAQSRGGEIAMLKSDCFDVPGMVKYRRCVSDKRRLVQSTRSPSWFWYNSHSVSGSKATQTAVQDFLRVQRT